MPQRFVAVWLVAPLLAWSGIASANPAALTNVPPATVDATDDVAAVQRRGRPKLAALVLPPAKPDEFREPVTETKAPAFPFNPFVTPRPAEPAPAAAAPAPAGPALAAAPEPSTNWFGTFFGQQPAQPRGTQLPALASRAEIDRLITHHARLNGVPETLVHRIVVRESKYNPRAVGRGGAMGLMQIKTGTARALGYQGGPAGLLDAETNITYAVKYLAGAWRTAGGNHDLAVSHYASGYYYAAKRQGLTQTASRSDRRRGRVQEADATPAEPVAPAAPALPSFLSFASANGSAAPDRAGR